MSSIPRQIRSVSMHDVNPNLNKSLHLHLILHKQLFVFNFIAM